MDSTTPSAVRSGWPAIVVMTASFVLLPASTNSVFAQKKDVGRPAAAGRIAFREVAAEAGVGFRFDTGSRGRHDLPEIMGGGVALFDADGDGRLDIYLCNGGPIEPAPGRATLHAGYIATEETGTSKTSPIELRAGAELRDGGGRRRL